MKVFSSRVRDGKDLGAATDCLLALLNIDQTDHSFAQKRVGCQLIAETLVRVTEALKK